MEIAQYGIPPIAYCNSTIWRYRHILHIAIRKYSAMCLLRIARQYAAYCLLHIARQNTAYMPMSNYISKHGILH